eukprot:2101842-Amphidinium_carterae.1
MGVIEACMVSGCQHCALPFFTTALIWWVCLWHIDVLRLNPTTSKARSPAEVLKFVQLCGACNARSLATYSKCRCRKSVRSSIFMSAAIRGFLLKSDNGLAGSAASFQR